MMPETLSANTQAILLLTAPLMLGRGKTSGTAGLLKPTEYQRLVRHLIDLNRQPADLLSPSAEELIASCTDLVAPERMRALLGRGFLLSQALERWTARAIWVVSRADAQYPRLLKTKLKARAPAVLYGCGDISLLAREGLAIVGSRKITGELVTYAADAGALAARADCPVVSGGARGVDRAAMDGALEAGGAVVGVLAEELEREAMHRKNRAPLRRGQLVLVSEYDPCSPFSVGHAMQRNKLIYAFARHALVVNSDLERGGTWAGAVEQLDKFQFSTVFVRSTGPRNEALAALMQRGALPWPNPTTATDLRRQLLAAEQPAPASPRQMPQGSPDMSVVVGREEAEQLNGANPAEALLQAVEKIILAVLEVPRTESEIADTLEVSRSQARDWLRRLSDRGVVERSERPVRYHRAQESIVVPNAAAS